MELPLFGVDAFTSRPFCGNPAAVCLLNRQRPTEWMQALASEMNLAETAFVRRDGEAFHLRWLTPKVEVDLCGHATLASAHVLWETARLAADQPAIFETRSGRLTCVRRKGWIEMDFPADGGGETSFRAELLGAMGIEGSVVSMKRNSCDYLLELESEPAVAAVAPDFTALAPMTKRGVIVTARSDRKEFDFVSRFFAPSVGIDEDPVTGSAHCFLGPHWAEILGKEELIGYQASRRGGTVRVAVRGNRVILGGRAVTVYRANLAV